VWFGTSKDSESSTQSPRTTSSRSQLVASSPDSKKRFCIAGYLLSILVLAALPTFMVTKTVAKIEDKYLETHLVFLDPLSIKSI